MYKRQIQEGLVTSANPWVSLHRGHDAQETQNLDEVFNGTNEISMRGQFQAWRAQMLAGMSKPGNN